MNIVEVSKIIKIAIKHLREMQKDGIISEPLTQEQINNLFFLSLFWGKQKWLKRQMGRISTYRRQELVEKSGLNKIESYIYSRLKSAKERGEKITHKQIIKEIELYYSVNKEQRKVIVKVIRNMRARIRYKMKKSGELN